MKKQIIAVIALFILFACNRTPDPKTRFAERHPKGKVISKVICKEAPDQSYCLYLPSNYDPDKSLPIIYLFDPDADGRLPVLRMKDMAEKLGYILVGSNNSKNGIDQAGIQKIVRILLEDTRQHLAIDYRRVYTAGFSGGARVACSVALSSKGIAGVIACSAGFRPGPQIPGFVFIGVAGIRDMNYLEVAKLTQYLQSRHADVQFLVFDGKHNWPPQKFLDEAMVMLDLYSMKNSVIPVDKEMVDSLKQIYSERIQKRMQSSLTGERVKAYNLSNQAVSLLDGLTDISDLEADQKVLQNQKAIQERIAEKAALQEKEAQSQQQIADAFNLKTKQWWDRKLDSLNTEAGRTDDSLYANTAVRLMGFISLNCYGFVKHALESNNWNLLEFITNIYLRSDPENYYAWYAKACLDVVHGKTDKALDDLKKSIEFDNPDVEKFKNDPYLAPLKDNAEFKNLAN